MISFLVLFYKRSKRNKGIPLFYGFKYCILTFDRLYLKNKLGDMSKDGSTVQHLWGHLFYRGFLYGSLEYMETNKKNRIFNNIYQALGDWRAMFKEELSIHLLRLRLEINISFNIPCKYYFLGLNIIFINMLWWPPHCFMVKKLFNEKRHQVNVYV